MTKYSMAVNTTVKIEPNGASLGGSVVMNLPANAGDTGSIPDLGGSHMPWINSAHVPQLLRLCSRVQELNY